jgi:hypothetical protein
VLLEDIYITPQLESSPTLLNKVHNLKNDSGYLYPVIESNRPYIFLPEEICEEIAGHMGAQYDNQTSHYLMTETSYKVLQSKGTSLIFQIAPSKLSKNVNITLPSTSLALRLDYPLRPTINDSSWYLPIRRSQNKKQLALGRAFLQNAVLISDYERNTFSVHQAVPAQAGYKSDVRPILMNRRNTLDSWNEGLYTAEIAGISVGAIAVTLLAGLLIFCLRRRKRNTAALKQLQVNELRLKEETALSDDPSSTSSTLFNGSPHETNSNEVQEMEGETSTPRVELDITTVASELPDSSGTGSLTGLFKDAELGGIETNRVVFEVEGSPVSTEILRRVGPGGGSLTKPCLPTYSDATDQNQSRKGRKMLRPQDVAPLYPTVLPLTIKKAGNYTKSERLRRANDAPASPIPQTPLEYYRQPGAADSELSKIENGR